jgi:hypothetical protein
MPRNIRTQHRLFSPRGTVNEGYRLPKRPNGSLPSGDIFDPLVQLYLFSFDHPGSGLRARIKKVGSIRFDDFGNKSQTIRGNIYSKRRPEGGFEREIHMLADGRILARHNFLDLNERVQGKGFATAFSRKVESGYKQKGVSAISLEAALLGAYVWARQGYIFSDYTNYDTHQPIDSARGARVWWRDRDAMQEARGLVKKKKMSASQFEMIEKRINSALLNPRVKPITPSFIAEMGRDKPWDETSGETTWVGKYILANTSFAALKILDKERYYSRSN